MPVASTDASMATGMLALALLQEGALLPFDLLVRFTVFPLELALLAVELDPELPPPQEIMIPETPKAPAPFKIRRRY